MLQGVLESGGRFSLKREVAERVISPELEKTLENLRKAEKFGKRKRT